MMQAHGSSLPGHPNDDAHCYSRALLVTVFLLASQVGHACICAQTRCFVSKFFITTCYVPCGPSPPTHLPIKPKGRPAHTHTKTESANENGAAPIRRAHEISLNANSTITGDASSWTKLARASKQQCPLHIHAHSLLLYFLASQDKRACCCTNIPLLFCLPATTEL